MQKKAPRALRFNAEFVYYYHYCTFSCLARAATTSSSRSCVSEVSMYVMTGSSKRGMSGRGWRGIKERAGGGRGGNMKGFWL